jgi:hypothetical protein
MRKYYTLLLYLPPGKCFLFYPAGFYNAFFFINTLFKKKGCKKHTVLFFLFFVLDIAGSFLMNTRCTMLILNTILAVVVIPFCNQNLFCQRQDF